jgi:SAM-dependent methyltransferase
VHGYRTYQHWNQWLAHQFLGSSLLDAEANLLAPLLERHFGKHALLIGVPSQIKLLHATHIPCHSLLSPVITEKKIPGYIESDFHELPILTGSIDLVIMPHTLEVVDNPRQLLAEACRIVKPEGLIAICGFNPYSAWGLRKMLAKKKTIPWQSNFIRSQQIKSWLHLVDFEMEQHTSALFRPPVRNEVLYKKLHYLERIGNKCFPMFGGVYVLLARAKVIPLTPIRLKWTQQLGNINVSTISGHIAHRVSK